MNLPRVLLAAGASGSGKTLVTCGLLQALKERGLSVSSFKCGPDYIDPMFHSRIIGTNSRNLDTFFTGNETTRDLLAMGAEGTELAVMEGVMGYYDGVGGVTTRASAYDLACVTDTPVLLVVNSKGMSLSLAAYIKGFLEYKADSHIRGVILNQMSPMLYPRMKDLIEKEADIPVYGYVPKVEDCVIESRHLGLVLPHEVKELQAKLSRLAGILESTLDIDGILELARSAEPLEVCTEAKDAPEESFELAVAKDEAFCFFYEDNFRYLRSLGAKLTFFSPLRDEKVPEGADGLLLYGGYPELYAKELSANASMRRSVADLAAKGMPLIAECGGFMYLHEEMEDMEGALHPMCGVIRGKAYRTEKLRRFGYITLTQKAPVFGEEALGPIPAHEFHYFESESCGEAFHAKKPESERSWECMHGNSQMLAGFPHLHYYGNPNVADAFAKACMRYHENKEG